MRFGLTFLVSALIFSSLASAAPTVASDYETGIAQWDALKASQSTVCDPTLDSYEVLQGHKTDYAVLVLHGYTHSPHKMDSYVQLFASLGNNVIAPRLAKHFDAADLKDLDHVRWSEWTKEADQAYIAATHLGKKVIVVGYSLGGLLATRLALTHKDIDSIYLFAPALRMTAKASLGAEWSTPASFVSDLMGLSSLSLNMIKGTPATCGVGYYSAWGGAQIESLMADDETSFGGVYPALAPSSFFSLTLPIFMAVDRPDAAVDTDALRTLLNGAPSRLRGYLLIDNGNHNMWVQPDTLDLVPKIGYEFAQGLTLRNQILKFYKDSHSQLAAAN